MEEIDLSTIQIDKQQKTKDKKIYNDIKKDDFVFDVNNIINNKLQSINTPSNNKIIEKWKPIKDDNKKNSIDKRRLILILQFYVLEFPDKLKTWSTFNFEKCSEKELQNLKNEFDFIIGAKCNIKSTELLVLQGVNILEFACVNFTPLKVNGLTSVINDKDFQDDIKHLALKYMTLVKTEPEQRILFKLLSTMLVLHNINGAKGSINNGLNKINEKYSDL